MGFFALAGVLILLVVLIRFFIPGFWTAAGEAFLDLAEDKFERKPFSEDEFLGYEIWDDDSYEDE